VQRLRLTFSKTAAMKFTGHLDLHKTWERTVRRARLPLAYSEGFSPHPKIQLAAALPLGFTSECEIVDVWLESEQNLDEVRAALSRAAAPGVVIHGLGAVPALEPALQTQVAAAEYRVTVAGPLNPAEVDERVALLLAQPEIRRMRRNKPYDLRPLIESLGRVGSDALGHALVMRLAARAGATGRPEEVVEALGFDPHTAAYHRTKLYLAETAHAASPQITQATPLERP
jgi:radical SAM-linked protein